MPNRVQLSQEIGEINTRMALPPPPEMNHQPLPAIAGMRVPPELQKDGPLDWSPGTGQQVWRLFCACDRGDTVQVQAILAQQPELIQAQHAYRQPLYFAVRANQPAVVAALLQAGANPVDTGIGERLLALAEERSFLAVAELLRHNLQEHWNAWDEGETTAMAIRQNDAARLQTLLAQDPALLHKGDRRGNQPIHWATLTRNIPLFDWLLEKGADPNAQRPDGSRPIHLFRGDYNFRSWAALPAGAAEPPAMLDHVIAKGGEPDLSTLAHRGDLAHAQRLLSARPELANQLSTSRSYYLGCGSPLQNAAACGHQAMVELLLQHGADPNLREEGMAPRGRALYAAVSGRHHALAKRLLEVGANPNQQVESSGDCLSTALRLGEDDLADLLCSHGAASPMEILSYYGQLRPAAAALAANPALANDPDSLSCAAENGQAGFVHLLLRYVPDLATRTHHAGGESLSCTRQLLAAGLSANFPDWAGVPPLHKIAARGDEDCARLYLDHGASLTARDAEHGLTPLAWAAKAGRANLVRLLLASGAPPKEDDAPAWAQPLALAQRRGHLDVVAALVGGLP